MNPLRKLRRHSLVIDGRHVNVHELSVLRPTDAEQPDLPTFVLVHGLGVSSRYFVPLAELLSRHGRVVVFDLPGFGGVPRPGGAMTVRDFAAVVVGALGQLAVTNPVLVGHSFGAQIVVEAAAANPGLTHSVLLIGPVVSAEQRDLRVLARSFLRSSLHERLASALVSIKAYVMAGPRWPLELLPAMLRYPIEERIALLEGDLAIIVGENDATCPVEWAEALAAAATAARSWTAVIDGAAHQVVIDDADRVAEAALTVAGIGTAPLG